MIPPRHSGLLAIGVPLLGVLLLALSPSVALAQQPFSLGRWSGRFEAGADWNRETSERTSDEVRLRRRRYNQRFTIRNSGIIVGRRLLVLRGSTVLGLRQERVVSAGSALPTAGRLLTYELSGNLFADKPSSLGFSATRSGSVYTPELGATSTTDTESTNITLRLSTLPFSPTFTAQRFHIDQEARSGDRVIHTVETRKMFTFAGSERNGWHSLNLSWRYNDRSNDLVPGSGQQTHSASAQQNIRLPWLNTDGLRGSLQFFRREGPERTTRLNISEILSVQVMPSLSTTLSYGFSERHVRSRVFVSTSATGALSHQLYQSLSTNLSMSVGSTRMPTGRRGRAALRYGVNYRKRIIGGGRLGINYSLGKQSQTNDFGADEIDVLQERHEGRIGVLVTLKEPFVVPGSLVVSNESGNLVFQEGVDYLVEIIGNLTQVSITPEGRIDDGQVLMIDYRVLAAPGTRVKSSTKSSSISIDYGWIAASYSSGSSGQDLIEGNDRGIIAPRSSRSYSLRTRFDGRRFRLVASGDYGVEDSATVAYTVLSLNQFFGYQMGGGATLSVNLSESIQHSRIPMRTSRNALARITARWSLGPLLDFDALVTARLRDDTDGRSEAYYEAGFGTEWGYGAFKFTCDLRHFWTRRDGADRTGFRAALRLARQF